MHCKTAALTVTSLLVVGLSGGFVTAAAETSAEDAKDYRIALKTAMRGHIGAILMNVRGLVEGHGFLDKHANALAEVATELRHVFPAGSNVGDSKALAAIWDEPDAFAEAIAEAEQATAEFARAASSGDGTFIAAAFRNVGAACRGCHDRFRKDDD
jgi:cytochrome c556